VCVKQTDDRLTEMRALLPDALAVAAGLTRRGEGGGGGKPGSRPPLNDTATDALDEIRNALTTIARDIAETRGLQNLRIGPTHPDSLAQACVFVSGQMNWLRHAADGQGTPYAVSVFSEVADCASRMRGIVNGPAEQRYLGPCGATIQVSEHPLDADGLRTGGVLAECDGDVYGRVGAQHGTCRTCGAQVDQAERRAWLDDEVRQHSYTAAEIADAYGIKANTIRQWLSRGLLATHGELNGRPLLKLGEVLDLAAGDKARREEARAARARRAAVRAAENEDAA
jgi:hypothetical protein